MSGIIHSHNVKQEFLKVSVSSFNSHALSSVAFCDRSKIYQDLVTIYLISIFTVCIIAWLVPDFPYLLCCLSYSYIHRLRRIRMRSGTLIVMRKNDVISIEYKGAAVICRLFNLRRYIHSIFPLSQHCKQLVHRSILPTENSILEPERRRRSRHGIPSPIQPQSIVSVVLRIGKYPLVSIFNPQMIAQFSTGFRRPYRNQGEFNIVRQELLPHVVVLEDLLLAEGSSERSRQYNERYTLHEARHGDGSNVETIYRGFRKRPFGIDGAGFGGGSS